jgi:spore coat polysaccharide biosynthesis protein SpsF
VNRTRAVVLIQARLASSRLPAKALLPLAGMPSVVLCALRAANTGLDVCVATSDTRADDAIAAAVDAAGVRVFRGDHLDVLARFDVAARGLPEDAVVVRLTADNVFPDGAFVQHLLDAFAHSGAEYLGTGSPQDGLPYGMSAEVFTVEALRRAARTATGAGDREHVTPWIRRHCRVATFAWDGAPAHWSRLRCTLDTFEDYAALEPLLRSRTNVPAAPWRDLVESLAEASICGRAARTPFRTSVDGRVHSRFTLGTVQLGLPYGVANATGMPPEEDARTLLAIAADAGVTHIDTARAYGESEARIGRMLPSNYSDRVTIVTKLDVLAGLPADASAATVRAAVDASVMASLRALRRGRLEVLLLHRHAHLHAWQCAAWQRLKEWRSDGVVGALGVSVTNDAEAVDALGNPDVVWLQCPVNALDHRWRKPGFLAAVARRPEVVVHARSALLQGLLTLPAARWPRVEGIDAARIVRTLDELELEFGREGRVDLCLAYVAAQPWVTSLVVGSETSAQLRANLALIARPPLTAAQVTRVHQAFEVLPDQLLDPARWKEAA